MSAGCWYSKELAVCQAANRRLQRTVMDKVPTHRRLRAVAKPGRRASPLE